MRDWANEGGILVHVSFVASFVAFANEVSDGFCLEDEKRFDLPRNRRKKVRMMPRRRSLRLRG